MTVYKINIALKLNTLLIVGYLNFNGEVITGGNSRVLYDKHKDQFLVDTRNCRVASSGQPTIYDRVPACSLTKLPLYHKGGNTIELVGWNFQYISEASDCKATSFLYSGYGDLSVRGQVNLKSDKPIKYFYDNYSFFLAITDCDLYLTNVLWNGKKEKYTVFSDTLSNTINYPSKRK